MWETYCERLFDVNPDLRNPENRMTIKSGELVRVLRQAYDRGFSDGLASETNRAKAAKDFQDMGGPEPSFDLPDFLKSLCMGPRV